MVVIESKYPKGADFKLWKIGPKLEDHAKFSAQKLIRQRSFASKACDYSEQIFTSNSSANNAATWLTF
jgi:hypothetical protein